MQSHGVFHKETPAPGSPDSMGAVMSSRAAEILAIPLQHALGVRLLDVDDPAVGCSFIVGELADNGTGALHAAALGAIIETAGYLALLPALDGTQYAVTHAIATQLFAAARLGEQVDVRASIDRRTRRLAFLSVLATVGDTTIARAQLTKSILGD